MSSALSLAVFGDRSWLFVVKPNQQRIMVVMYLKVMCSRSYLATKSTGWIWLNVYFCNIINHHSIPNFYMILPQVS